MRRRRLALAAILAVAAAPGTLVRTTIPEIQADDLVITRVTDLPATRSRGGVTREGVWQLASERLDFGGYSAVLVLDEGSTLRAFSDRGRVLTFPSPPPSPGSARARPAYFAAMWDRGDLSHTLADIEAATRDPASGDYWVAFENTHALIRYSRANDFEASLEPPEWQDWDSNAGAEAMARLADGRFLVLPENGRTGLLYPSDPIDGTPPVVFTPILPEGYYPTDMAALPDGRVMVLLRNVVRALPPFSTALVIGDPDMLAQNGDSLDFEFVLLLEDILPRENYEALAVAGVADDGTVDLWLMSDDNVSAFQRTLLARLRWRG